MYNLTVPGWGRKENDRNMTNTGLPAEASFFARGAAERQREGEIAGKYGNDGLPDCGVRGMISYPCCPGETVMVYQNAHGQVSNKCPRCGKFARFDYDRMTATAVRACRGASQLYKRRG